MVSSGLSLRIKTSLNSKEFWDLCSNFADVIVSTVLILLRMSSFSILFAKFIGIDLCFTVMMSMIFLQSPLIFLFSVFCQNRNIYFFRDPTSFDWVFRVNFKIQKNFTFCFYWTVSTTTVDLLYQNLVICTVLCGSLFLPSYVAFFTLSKLICCFLVLFNWQSFFMCTKWKYWLFFCLLPILTLI